MESSLSKNFVSHAKAELKLRVRHNVLTQYIVDVNRLSVMREEVKMENDGGGLVNSNLKRSDNCFLKKRSGQLDSCVEPTQPLMVQPVVVQAHAI
ncbi:hypothetical protein VNO80_03005 [Phaseolus coccineus]|uniref:Uncharacterized protein n=1 Tax=Phaseolus coccineus TaxID=3886 RepID=A0AAN9NV96_PHACN